MQQFMKKAAACLAATAMLIAVPASAEEYTQAEKLRRLDIMLMVTGLRCRTTPSNFQSDFAAFEGAHLKELNAAASEMRGNLVAKYGAAGANRALDRVSTGIANEYGQGHPWLDCAGLKSVAQSLTRMRGTAALVEAADQLLADHGNGTQLAWAR